jgi:hypothetical protein
MRKGMSDVEIMRAFDAYFRSAQHHGKPVNGNGRSNSPGRIPLGKGRELLQAAAEEKRNRKRSYSELRNSFGSNGNLKQSSN